MLVASLHAHAEWQRVTGATGLPRASEALKRERIAADDGQDVPASTEPERDQASSTSRAAVRVPGAVRAVEAQGEPPAAAPRSAATVAQAVPGTVHAATATAVHPVADADAHARLITLQEEVRGCTRCGLHAARTQTVFARGNGTSGLCFVGEGPGADEDARGLPFVGKAGQLLDRMIAAMGFSRDDVYVCNVVKCRPPKNRKPELDEMSACRPYLEEQLELVAPTVIVALGATAVQGLLGVTGGITRLRGEWRLYKGRIPVMPTFHPAYLLRQPGAKRDVWQDLQTVLTHMGRTPPERAR